MRRGIQHVKFARTAHINRLKSNIRVASCDFKRCVKTLHEAGNWHFIMTVAQYHTELFTKTSMLPAHVFA